MCAIFGIGFQEGHKIEDAKVIRDIVIEMFELSSQRGTDATGMAITSMRKISVFKHKIPAKRFIELPKLHEILENRICLSSNKFPYTRTVSIIGHCRMKTKGTPENNDNNHPIVANGIIGVHNGVITNDDDLFNTYIQRSDDFIRRAEVDSEIIFRLLDHYSIHKKRRISFSIKLCSALLKGGYACAFVSKRKPFMVWLFRNYNPLDIICFPKVGVIMFSSAKEYIKKVTNNVDFGLGIEMILDQQQAVGINLLKNGYYKFGLDRYSKMKKSGSKPGSGPLALVVPNDIVSDMGDMGELTNSKGLFPLADQNQFYRLGINI